MIMVFLIHFSTKNMLLQIFRVYFLSVPCKTFSPLPLPNSPHLSTGTLLFRKKSLSKIKYFYSKLYILIKWLALLHIREVVGVILGQEVDYPN
jgi:hypothetical protein